MTDKSSGSGLLSDIRQIARGLGIKQETAEKAFLRSLSVKRVVNYLAEMGETSPDTISSALTELGFPECRLEDFAAGLQQRLKIVTGEEIERSLISMLDATSFVRALERESGKSQPAVLAAIEQTSLRPTSFRHRISQRSDGAEATFSNVPTATFEPGSKGLAFARGKIYFVGLKSPPRSVNAERPQLLKDYCDAVLRQVQSEPLPVFKGGILESHERFFRGEMADADELLPDVRRQYGTNESAIIDAYLLDTLGTKDEKSASRERRREAIAAVKGRIKYVITFGIGGNEMRWHALADFHNNEASSGKKWIPLHSADEIGSVPDDADRSNTVKFAFSRGGNTEETKAAEEVLHGRFPVSIIYANSGELRALGMRHGALVLPFPRRIAGRYCGLKTSLNLAPMYLLGMDTRAYWEASDRADRALDITAEKNLSWQLARFIFFEKELAGVKMMYLGHNSKRIGHSLNELAQYVMEGLAKEKNELFAMVGMPYLRNTHYEIEGPLGNPRFFLFWDFLLCQNRAEERFRYAYAADEQKQKLHADQVNAALMAATLAIYASHSPSIVFLLADQSLETLAYLSKIYEDTIYLLCRLTNVDPFGNPCVKQIRDRSAGNVRSLFSLSEKELRDTFLIYRLIEDVSSE